MIRRSVTDFSRSSIFFIIGDIVHSPSLGDYKLFYTGINWEALGRGKIRHQELLKRLDKTGLYEYLVRHIFRLKVGKV